MPSRHGWNLDLVDFGSFGRVGCRQGSDRSKVLMIKKEEVSNVLKIEDITQEEHYRMSPRFFGGDRFKRIGRSGHLVCSDCQELCKGMTIRYMRENPQTPQFCEVCLEEKE